MKIEKDQKNQIVVLCVLVAIVLGFGVYRMMGVGTKASSPAKAPVKQVQKAPDATATSDSPTDTSETEALVQTMGFVKPAKDPFTPQVLPPDPETTAAQTLPSQNSRMQKVPLIARDTRMSLPIMPSFGGPNGGFIAPVVEQVDPTKNMKLTGVVEGENNIAVIRDGDSRHIVREGQSLNGGLVVRSISRSGVRLSGNGRSYFLALGTGKDG